ncbi:hypothetical protein BCR33DRAFT_782246 [Rhizoclosmatium globosum]|uniref:Uncharacterized protein n=1 Tax=Rhizoclosmatium globosum TaxID=329046 RepID=A0A1Y2CNF9_9FUNG|nr:hypothetical protein BCR33DRAFT_782246 [Rhizoclosmatium globosum]|eukprot:ORY48533.1 hypothetical protein BCR33DRAFT_782246 [Rhizoclosmatium globosum]
MRRTVSMPLDFKKLFRVPLLSATSQPITASNLPKNKTRSLLLHAPAPPLQPPKTPNKTESATNNDGEIDNASGDRDFRTESHPASDSNTDHQLASTLFSVGSHVCDETESEPGPAKSVSEPAGICPIVSYAGLLSNSIQPNLDTAVEPNQAMDYEMDHVETILDDQSQIVSKNASANSIASCIEQTDDTEINSSKTSTNVVHNTDSQACYTSELLRSSQFDDILSSAELFIELLPQTTCNVVGLAENGDSMTDVQWKDSDVTFDAWTATQSQTVAESSQPIFECVKETHDSITLDGAGAKDGIEPPVVTGLNFPLSDNFNLRVETETERLLIVEEESVLKQDSVEDSIQTTDHIPDDCDHIISPILLASEIILSIWPMKPSERAVQIENLPIPPSSTSPFTLFPLDISAPQTPTCVSLVNDDVTLINPDQEREDISGNDNVKNLLDSASYGSAFTIYNPPLSPKTKLANEIGQVEELNQPAISSRIDTMVTATDISILQPLQRSVSSVQPDILEALPVIKIKPVAHISDIGRAGMVSRIPIAKSQLGIPIQKSNYESIPSTVSKSEHQPPLKEKKLGKPETALLFSPKRKRAAAVASNAKTKVMFESLGPKGGTKRKYHKE